MHGGEEAKSLILSGLFYPLLTHVNVAFFWQKVIASGHGHRDILGQKTKTKTIVVVGTPLPISARKSFRVLWYQNRLFRNFIPGRPAIHHGWQLGEGRGDTNSPSYIVRGETGEKWKMFLWVFFWGGASFEKERRRLWAGRENSCFCFEWMRLRHEEEEEPGNLLTA